jgi:hypothetical protein
MRKSTVSTILWMVLAWMLPMTAAAEDVRQPPGPIAEISVSPTRIDWLPTVDAGRWVLTLAGPDELVVRREFKAGKAPHLELFDSEGNRLPDGSYTWELRLIPQGQRGLRKGSGSFSIQDGSFVEIPQGTGGPAPKPTLITKLIDDKLVIQGNSCLGDSCATNDANYSALKIKSVQPNILFDGIELPEGGGGSSHDWALFVNYLADRFSIVDFSNGLIPFSVAAGAPDNSLYVAGDGKVGIGTSSPADSLHIVENNENTKARILVENSSTGVDALSGVRLQSDSAIADYKAHGSGRTLLRFGQSVAGWGELTILSGNGLAVGTIVNKPLTLGTNDTNRLHITGAGDIGIGTSSPGTKLEIQGSAANSDVVRIRNSSATGFPGIDYLDAAGSTGLYFGLDNAAGTTRMNSVNNHPIVILTNSTERIRFPAPGGNFITASNGAFLSSGGTWINASSRESKRDIVELSEDDALKALEGLTPVTFRYKTEPDEQYIGFIAEDVPDLVATNDHKHLSSMDVVALLTKVVKEQQKTINDLSARLADLEEKEK